MSIYDFATLMTQTRKLAADYRQTTGQALPVTTELAKFDAITLLDLQEVTDANGYDAVDPASDPPGKIQIKGRVLFEPGKGRAMVGQLNVQADWDSVVLVLYDEQYEPYALYRAERSVLESALTESRKRGSMTVAKFKALSQAVWQSEAQST